MSDHQKSAVVLLSGGLDSMVSAALAREAGYALHALTVDYNQRNRLELQSADRIAKALGACSHIVLPINLRAFGGSALTADIEVPQDGVDGSIPITYVPARITNFLSLALGLAAASGALHLFIGANALHFPGYPDFRPAFLSGFH